MGGACAIWTVAVVPDLDRAAAHIGGDARLAGTER